MARGAAGWCRRWGHTAPCRLQGAVCGSHGSVVDVVAGDSGGEDSVGASSVQSLSCVRLCDPMNRSTPGLPVHHQLLESTQTHVH